MEEVAKKNTESKFSKIWRRVPNKLKTVVVTVLCTALVMGPSWGNIFNQQDNGTMISNYIKRISELSTVEHSYTYIGEFNDSLDLEVFVLKFNVPFTKKHFIGVFEGTIKYGINMSKIGKAKINKAKKTITIKMPEIVRTNHNINMKSIKYYDQDNNLFNPIKAEDSDEFKKKHMKDAEKQDVKNGVLSYVQKQTQKDIELLVTNMFDEYKDYKVVCEFPDQKDIKTVKKSKF